MTAPPGDRREGAIAQEIAALKVEIASAVARARREGAAEALDSLRKWAAERAGSVTYGGEYGQGKEHAFEAVVDEIEARAAALRSALAAGQEETGADGS